MIDNNSKCYEEAAKILKALSHPARLKIIEYLYNHECNVSDLEKMFNITQSGISQHLRLLRLSGIIEPIREGKEICYKIVNPKIIDIIKMLLNK